MYLIQRYLWKKVKEKISNNEDNEVKRQSEDKMNQYDNEDYNEEIPINK